jgi:ATP-dependent DNA helicase RecG
MIPEEGQTVERKESLSLWRDIAETCAAFATAQGGKVFVGVADDGRITGVQIGKGTLEDLANRIAQNTTPKVVPTITTQGEPGATVIILDVPEHQTKPVTAFGRPYRRSGRTNQVLSASEVAELYLASRGLTWDETIKPDATLSDIDPEKVSKFLSRAIAERQWQIDPQTPVQQALKQLDLMRNGQLTVAALLLFSRRPQHFFVQGYLRCARFKGNSEVEFLDMKLIEGDIVAQVEEAMAFVRRNIRMAAKIEGQLERKERWEYPLDAVREGITNAVCHRDYADSGNVLVKIFDDRLEIWNPGSLPSGLTVDDLRKAHESKPRNKLIARAFFLIKYIEQFGTGTGRMISDCREAEVPEPEFESRASSFRIIFRRPISVDEALSRLNLNARQKIAVKHAMQHGKLTRADYEKVAGVPRATANRDLAELIRMGLLKKRGATRGAWYEFIFSGNEKISEKIMSRDVSRKNTP